MKVVVEIVDIDKATVLDSCLLSREAKQCGPNVLLWYYTKGYWREDRKSLEKTLNRKIQHKCLPWNDERFVCLKS